MSLETGRYPSYLHFRNSTPLGPENEMWDPTQTYRRQLLGDASFLPHEIEQSSQNELKVFIPEQPQTFEECMTMAYYYCIVSDIVKKEFPNKDIQLAFVPKSSHGVMLIKTIRLPINLYFKVTQRESDMFEKITRNPHIYNTAGLVDIKRSGIRAFDNKQRISYAMSIINPTLLLETSQEKISINNKPVAFAEIEGLPGRNLKEFLQAHPNDPLCRDRSESIMGMLAAGFHKIPVIGDLQKYSQNSQRGDPDIYTHEQKETAELKPLIFQKQETYRGYPLPNIITELFSSTYHEYTNKNLPELLLPQIISSLQTLAHNKTWTQSYNLPFGKVLNHLDLKPENVMVCPVKEMEQLRTKGLKTQGIITEIGGELFEFVLIDTEFSGPGDSAFYEFGEIFFALLNEGASEEQQRRTIKNILQGLGVKDYESPAMIDVFHNIAIVTRLITLYRHIAHTEDIVSERTMKYIQDVDQVLSIPNLREKCIQLNTWLNNQQMLFSKK